MPHDQSSASASGPSDLAILIDRLSASGGWPEPNLLAQILAAGKQAVEPLREVARSRPRGWPEEAPLVYAVGLLGDLKADSAIPELAAVAQDYLQGASAEAGRALARLGGQAFDALLEIIRDPRIVGRQREDLIDAAASGVSGDPDPRGRLSEVLRSLFSLELQNARDVRKFEEELISQAEAATRDDPECAGPEPSDDEGSDYWPPVVATTESPEVMRQRRETINNEVLLGESLAFLASSLCALGDQSARAQIQAAFDEDLIDSSVFSRRGFLNSFTEAPAEPRPLGTWLEEYTRDFTEHQELTAQFARLSPMNFPARASYPKLPPAEPLLAPKSRPDEPLRNAGPRLGRNDLCWCGSGKKYKKCHFGKDGPS